MAYVSTWQPIATAPDGIVIDTKIDDVHGLRNKAKLVKRGPLFFLPDGGMYVYYVPTHWRAAPPEE